MQKKIRKRNFPYVFRGVIYLMSFFLHKFDLFVIISYFPQLIFFFFNFSFRCIDLSLEMILLYFKFDHFVYHIFIISWLCPSQNSVEIVINNFIELSTYICGMTLSFSMTLLERTAVTNFLFFFTFYKSMLIINN